MRGMGQVVPNLSRPRSAATIAPFTLTNRTPGSGQVKFSTGYIPVTIRKVD